MFSNSPSCCYFPCRYYHMTYPPWNSCSGRHISRARCYFQDGSVYRNTYIHRYINVHIYMYIYIKMNTYIYIKMNTYIYINEYIHIYIINIQMYMHVFIEIYIRIHNHIYIHWTENPQNPPCSLCYSWFPVLWKNAVIVGQDTQVHKPKTCRALDHRQSMGVFRSFYWKVPGDPWKPMESMVVSGSL